MPAVKFFACLDLKQKSSFLDGHYLVSVHTPRSLKYDPNLAKVEHVPDPRPQGQSLPPLNSCGLRVLDKPSAADKLQKWGIIGFPARKTKWDFIKFVYNIDRIVMKITSETLIFTINHILKLFYHFVCDQLGKHHYVACIKKRCFLYQY
jgi:hypothetical protein